MTTNKQRLTVYFHNTRALDDLVELARRSVPIEARGRITRSTCCETAVLLALGELRANGKESAVLAALVTSPAPKAVQDGGG